MLKIFLTILCASISITGVTAAQVQEKTVASKTPESLEARVDSIIKQSVEGNQVPGMALGIVKNGKLVYAKGFGVAKLGGTTPVTSRTLFHMASVTKTFVATSIMQLFEQGKIDLDKPLTTYLPYFKMKDERYRSITIRQMLSHTSGIPDVQGYNWDKPEFDDKALERFVRSVSEMETVWTPGEKFGYSNTAFEVLGDVISKVSGLTFEDYVKQNILVPLRMNDSTLMVREASPALLSSPHVKRGDKVVVSEVFPYNRAHAPSSTLDSSIEDMSRWAIANLNRGELDGRRILKASTYDVMWKPVAAVGSSGKSSVGVSWFLHDEDGHRIASHSGGDVGFTSMLLLAPDDAVAVVAMSNYSPRDACYVCDVANKALRLALGLEMEAKPKDKETPETFTPVSQPVDAILDKYIQALGGRAALEKITSRISIGSLEIAGAALIAPLEIQQKAPNKKVMTLRLAQNQVYKNVFDGTAGWERDPDEGVKELKGGELTKARRESDLYYESKIKEYYPRISVKGSTKLNGKDTIVLEAPRNGKPKRWYFDPETGLLLRTEDRSGDGKVESWDEYSDYREVDGVKLPFLIRSRDNELVTIKLTDVKHNIPIADTVFVKPEQ